MPTAAIENGNQGDYVFVVNPGPTPPDKLKNLPGGTPANVTTGAKSKRSARRAGTAGDEEWRRRGSQRKQPRQPFHADVVLVHVDFTIGTNSVLSNSTTLQAGQQVVVDGQEKLVDGAPVTPAQAHTVPAINNGGAVGATNPSAATAPPAAGSGGLSPASPVPADASGDYPGSGRSGRNNSQNGNQNGGQSAPSGGGTH